MIALYVIGYGWIGLVVVSLVHGIMDRQDSEKWEAVRLRVQRERMAQERGDL